MRRAILIAAFSVAVLALARPAAAQDPVTFEVTIQPERATVGDHLTLTIVVRHPSDRSLEAPRTQGDFAPLRLIEVRPPETRDVGDGLQETQFEYVLAAFRPGEVRPVPLRIRVSGLQDTILTVQPPSVVIESVLPADSPVELRPLGSPLQASAGTPTWVWAALLAAAFVALTVVTMALVRLPVLGVPAPAVIAPIEAPGEAARRELDAIAGAGLLGRGELKEYYGRIAFCLRAYLADRFEVPARAMTAEELDGRLEALRVDRWPTRLAVNLLEQCQAVQFAQYEPARERAEADLASAYEVVELTATSENAARERSAPLSS